MSIDMNIEVIVIHASYGDEDNPKLVAIVESPHVSKDEGMTDEDHLEYAYRWTQNIGGSWSRGADNNPDYNWRVKKMQANEVIDGKTYGQRSTSVGDYMSLSDATGNIRRYRVAGVGFERVGEDFFWDKFKHLFDPKGVM